MGSAHNGHVVLLRVLLHDLEGVELPYPFHRFYVRRVIGRELDGVPAHDKGRDAFVREDRPDAPSAGLLEPCPSPLLVVP